MNSLKNKMDYLMQKWSNLEEPNIDKHTGLLKNKVNAKTQAQLDKIEAVATYYRITQLNELKEVYGDFDLKHSCLIHQTIFQDIYPWAGEVRKVNIAKGHTAFAHNEFIESSFNKLAAKLKNENYLQGLAPDQFAERAAYYLGEVNMIHPFREGNGRTQRLFINDLVRINGYEIAFDQLENATETIIKASIAADDMNYAPLTKIIKDNLIKLDKPVKKLPTSELKHYMQSIRQLGQGKQPTIS